MDVYDEELIEEEDDSELLESKESSGIMNKLMKIRKKLRQYYKNVKNIPSIVIYILHALSSRELFLKFCGEIWDHLKNTPVVVFYGYLWKTKKVQFFMNLFVSYGLPILLESLPWYFSRRKIGRNLRTQKNTITNTMIDRKSFNWDSSKSYIFLTVLYTLLENIERHLNYKVTVMNRLYVKRLVLEKILYSEVWAFSEFQGRELEYRISTEIHNTLRLFSFVVPNILSSLYAIMRESIELYDGRAKLDWLLIARPIASMITWRIIDWTKTQMTGKRKVLANLQSNQSVAVLFDQITEGLTEIQLNNIQQKKLIEYDNIVQSEFGVFEDLRLFFNRLYSSFTNRSVFDFLSETFVASMIMEKKDLNYEQYRKLQIDIDHLVKLVRRTGTYVLQATRSVERQTRVVKLMKLPNFQDEINDESLIKVDDFNDITLHNITFSYQKGGKKPYALNFSGKITFEKNSIYAIIGQNRSGKSTLVNLITKLYAPQEGTMTFNNIPYKMINRNSIREIVYYVAQKAYVFPGTIKDNICVGIDYIPTDKEIIRAAKYAGVFTFDEASINSNGFTTTTVESNPVAILPNEKTIDELLLADQPKKKLSKKKVKKILEMKTESRGSNLSGGFAQSVALARIYLQKRAKIIILDESTSAMDPIKKRDVIFPNLFKHIRKNQLTLLMISHDMTYLDQVDKIVLLSNGKIAGQGSHQELVEQNNETYLKMLGLSSKL
ncbi:predicted protein [Naegleria gruberi]|uniref:Predicted protein n=1 Tax=Naegleria gruberi TaxID=5762 RepID=D2VGQ8_NAEGR|nr:uncharacterized protein NAEGRDRAFT_68063 [Naegleria gruberi]EFC44010.1 predicted protein [Naegleria gruberi]|eukprot:XP_002676754.1 predicted protein [Naegleria gruberi strain NEG-M]